MEYPFPPIELQTQVKISDLYEVYFRWALSKMWYGRMGLAIALIILFGLWEGSVEFVRPLLEPPLLYVIVCVLLYSILLKPYLISRALIETSNGGTRTVSYVFSENGVDIRRGGYEGHYDWAAIRRAKQTPHLVVLYTDSNLAIILPKRSFADPQQLTDLRTLLTDKVKRRSTVPPRQN